MAYANSTTKRSQVLAQLHSNLAAIAPPTNSIEVKRVLTYQAQRLVLGGQNPAIAIVPVNDSRLRALTCDSDEYQMTAQIIGVMRVDASANAWKDKISLLAGDIQQTIANDRQLSGKAIYVEVENLDISDASTEGSRTLAVCVVTASIVYRVGVSDVTT